MEQVQPVDSAETQPLFLNDSPFTVETLKKFHKGLKTLAICFFALCPLFILVFFLEQMDFFYLILGILYAFLGFAVLYDLCRNGCPFDYGLSDGLNVITDDGEDLIESNGLLRLVGKLLNEDHVAFADTILLSAGNKYCCHVFTSY